MSSIWITFKGSINGFRVAIDDFEPGDVVQQVIVAGDLQHSFPRTIELVSDQPGDLAQFRIRLGQPRVAFRDAQVGFGQRQRGVVDRGFERRASPGTSPPGGRVPAESRPAAAGPPLPSRTRRGPGTAPGSRKTPRGSPANRFNEAPPRRREGREPIGSCSISLIGVAVPKELDELRMLDQSPVRGQRAFGQLVHD